MSHRTSFTGASVPRIKDEPDPVLLEESEHYKFGDGGLIEITSAGLDQLIKARAMGQDAVIEVDNIEVLVLRALGGSRCHV
jgi:hypothetical protein